MVADGVASGFYRRCQTLHIDSSQTDHPRARVCSVRERPIIRLRSVRITAPPIGADRFPRSIYAPIRSRDHDQRPDIRTIVLAVRDRFADCCAGSASRSGPARDGGLSLPQWHVFRFFAPRPRLLGAPTSAIERQSQFRPVPAGCHGSRRVGRIRAGFAFSSTKTTRRRKK